ncbi:hypothetical protein [Pectobacterium polaris]|uniref:hypothetical protein n=1 Tax=Pectobacterium polaris TaxID=2042057 RepID=UPI00202D0FC3|nr:hypothetical protein [Pectobacterium polaris]MCL6324015.1 hypothetical protein [Pectobacterium polaris]
MTTLSTAQLIEAMRTVAGIADTEQGREKLNAIANRMEMLVAANADMDLQLNSIRSALNIPAAQSVQSGVIDAFARQSTDIADLTEKSNRLRRTAKEHQEENQLLRTELIELNQQRDVLVAESVGLKGSVDHAAGCIHAAEVEGLIDALENRDGDRLADLIHRRLCHAHLAVETPATDEAMREIMAQGVEKYAEHIATPPRAVMEGYWEYSEETALIFAQQLREGKDGWKKSQQLRDGDA